MKTILITGIHGFVGTNLTKKLHQGNTIYGLDIITPQKNGVCKTYTWEELDIIPPVDVVIHLAGKAHDTKNKSEAQVYFDINTELTKKIFDWFLTSDAKKFIFFSTVKAAADIVEEDILTEDVVPKPKGPYGESKLAAESYINSQLSTLNPQLKTAHIFRPAMIHGPGNKGNLNLLYSVVKKGIPYPLGTFKNKRSFTSIDNLSFVIEQLLEKNDIPSGIYNIADDETLSTNELISLMATTLNKKERIWNWSPALIKAFAKLGTFIHLPLNTERLQKLTENYVVSNKKIKSVLNIEQMPISAKEGIIRTINSFE
ncbi:NAD-dependent epimerase/dehydratase family protein [Bacteroidales bacterium OttesenSCG-928-K03]|nr:NAD-dependent epimerase/dehydratase family protein [Odoribacter sp. OttesenSCG-928-L07]MDL2239373.1 NAD-dependent epimerase/dehydratase family protein [Bacteroidales bacterium OttesenSCG-928-L14]MDL2242716.1 NAD-dependent epimerase/dehydratase family protein [Bacteroidales bacterium OttesenSCG-928-K03]